MKIYPIALTFLAALTWGVACSSTTTPAPGDGDGDGDMSTTGGKPGSGGGGGTGGAYDCDPKLNEMGAGGAIHFTVCDTVDPNDPGGAWKALDCGQGGAGGVGGAGEIPALRAICEAPAQPQISSVHPIHDCLSALETTACEADHRDDVVECLTKKATCNRDLKDLGCVPYLNACPELTPSTCVWGFEAVHGEAGRKLASDCFTEKVAGEGCEDRFLRCVWGVE